MGKKARKSTYMFSSKTTSYKGIMAFLCGLISAGALGGAVFLSFLNRGQTPFRLGIVGILAVLVGIAGLTLAILGMMKQEEFQMFPRLGLACNIAVLGLWGYILYSGLFGA